MKKTMLIGLKDLMLAFRDQAALILMLLVPFTLTIGLDLVTGRFSAGGSNRSSIREIPVVIVNKDDEQLGNLIGGGFGGAPGSDNRIRLLVADEANSALSADLLTALQKSETVRADVLPRSQAEKAFEDPNTSALLIIPANFDMRRTLELQTQSNNLNGQAAERVVSAVAGGSAWRLPLPTTAWPKRSGGAPSPTMRNGRSILRPASDRLRYCLRRRLAVCR